jgi:hypothetical protein
MPTGVYKHKNLNHNGNFKKGMTPWNKGKKKFTDEQLKEKKRIYNIKNKEKLYEARKKWRENNYDKVLISNRKSYQKAGRNRNLQYNYGISLESYNLLLEKQNHKCAICGKEKVESDRTFCVDHNHITGEIRGLLCRNCNSGIGLLQDSEDILYKAIIYLKQ